MLKTRRETPKFLEARESLQDELRPIYDQLVDEYSFHALKHYGHNWAAYAVLAELVRDGWRPPQ